MFFSILHLLICRELWIRHFLSRQTVTSFIIFLQLCGIQLSCISACISCMQTTHLVSPMARPPTCFFSAQHSLASVLWLPISRFVIVKRSHFKRQKYVDRTNWWRDGICIIPSQLLRQMDMYFIWWYQFHLYLSGKENEGVYIAGKSLTLPVKFIEMGWYIYIFFFHSSDLQLITDGKNLTIFYKSVIQNVKQPKSHCPLSSICLQKWRRTSS